MGVLQHHNDYVSVQRGFSDAHKGIDYQWQIGNEAETVELHAAYDGVVSETYNPKTDGPDKDENGGWGGRIKVKVNDRVSYAYSHIRRNGLKVRKGAKVKAGELIALMGNTGDSRGMHLHFELYIDGKRVNPAPYFRNNLPGTVLRRVQRKTRRTPRGFVNGRVSPTLKSKVVQTLDAGRNGRFSVGNFDAVAEGDKVTQNGYTSNLWLRGAFNGRWFWIGNFADRSLTGLSVVSAK